MSDEAMAERLEAAAVLRGPGGPRGNVDFDGFTQGQFARVVDLLRERDEARASLVTVREQALREAVEVVRVLARQDWPDSAWRNGVETAVEAIDALAAPSPGGGETP